MEKFLLHGEWKIKSNSYDTVGQVPGSVYTALLANGLMEDPFYRDNEAKALAIMDEEFTFTKEFDYAKKSDSVLLVCEGLDTLCDLYVNDHFVAHTDNMHRTYCFEVAPYLVDGKNVIKAVFAPVDAFIKKGHKAREYLTALPQPCLGSLTCAKQAICWVGTGVLCCPTQGSGVIFT